VFLEIDLKIRGVLWEIVSKDTLGYFDYGETVLATKSFSVIFHFAVLLFEFIWKRYALQCLLNGIRIH